MIIYIERNFALARIERKKKKKKDLQLSSTNNLVPQKTSQILP